MIYFRRAGIFRPSFPTRRRAGCRTAQAGKRDEKQLLFGALCSRILYIRPERSRRNTEKAGIFFMNTRTDELILLDGILEDDAVRAVCEAAKKKTSAAYAQALRLLLEKGAENCLSRYFAEQILSLDNLFARQAYAGEIAPAVKQSYLHDLHILSETVTVFCSLRYPEMPQAAAGRPHPLFASEDDADVAEKTAAYHREMGYGAFIACTAFSFTEGKLVPIKNVPAVKLSDLKDYETEKRLILSNVDSFLAGLPASDMLLYGDKGTGKSSTIHAVLNLYAPKGLRAVELRTSQIPELESILETVSGLPFKFLIFIDDLSLDEKDARTGQLKAALEGSLHAKGRNVLICATSNRRHILKENFSDRENSVHADDTMEEQLSLSDRFGLTVRFAPAGKKEYLSIVLQLAKDMEIPLPDAELCALAERFALVKGGRSPRRARQFTEYISACVKKGTKADF